MEQETLLYIMAAIGIVYCIVNAFLQKRKDDLDSSLIRIVPEISQSLNAGYTIESIVNSLSIRRSDFAKIKEMALIIGYERAFAAVAQKSKNVLFIQISDIIAAQVDNKIKSYNLANLARMLTDVERQDKWATEKISSSLTTLQFAGIIVLPIVFYMIASSISYAQTIVQIDMFMQIYFIVITIVLSSLDLLVLKKGLSTSATLLLGMSITLLIITKFGSLIYGLFSMASLG